MFQEKFDSRKKRTVEVLGSKMAYVERGSGDPIVLLHGNPASSWPYLQSGESRRATLTWLREITIDGEP